MQQSLATLIKSKKPQERIEAINRIRQKSDANHQPMLVELARQDPDKRVRQAAIDALKNLPDGSRDEVVAEAHLFLEEANNAMFADKAKEARTYARRAFQLAPELEDDSLARDVAVYVMKMEADDAIAHLQSDKDLFAVDREFRKKMGYAYSDQSLYDRFMGYFNKWQVTLQDVLLDVALYIVVITLPFFLLMILAAGVLATSFTAMSAGRLAGQSGIIYDYADNIGYDSAALSLSFIFITVLIIGAILFSVFAFQMVLTHFSANWFLGGDGSFYRLIHHAFIPVTLYSIFVWAMFFGTPLLYFMGLGDLVDAGMIEVFNLIGFGVFIFSLSNTIGTVYNFDFGKGCLSLMFPYIVIFCSCGTIFGLRFGTEVRRLFGGG